MRVPVARVSRKVVFLVSVMSDKRFKHPMSEVRIVSRFNEESNEFFKNRSGVVFN